MTLANEDHIIARDGVVEPNGQFFLHQENRGHSEFQHLTGEKTITQEAIERFLRNVNLSAAYCTSAGIPYSHVVYPSKALAFRKEFAAAGVNLVGILSDAHRHEEVIYPLDDLVGTEDFEQLGSHCSDPGYLKIARIAFRSIGEPLDAYHPTIIQRPHQCDLAQMRGLPKQHVATIRRYEGLKRNIMRFSNSDMLPGNMGRVMYSLNEAAPIRRRVLMFGDSFFGGTLPVIAPLFQELIYMRSPHVIDDVANVLEPDFILTGNTERDLVNVPDKTCQAPYFISFFAKGVESDKLSERDREALLALFSGRNSAAFKTWRAKLKRHRARQETEKKPRRLKRSKGILRAAGLARGKPPSAT